MRTYSRAALSLVAGLALVATTAFAGGSAASAAGKSHSSKSHSSTAQVSLSTSSFEILAGDDAAITVTVSKASNKARSVRVTAVDGSAKAGVDFEAFNKRVAIPLGKKSVTVKIPTYMRGFDVPKSSFAVKLSSPSSLLKLSGRTSLRVTLIPFDIPPLDQGSVLTLEDFEGGVVPAGYSSWATNAGFPPPLSTVADGASNHALQVSAGPTPAGSAIGFESDLEPTDRFAWTGFSIAFYGTGSGRSFAVSLANGANVFEQTAVDTTVGWRVVRLAFDDLRLKGNPSSPLRYDRSTFDGYSVDVTGLGVGNWLFDEASVYDVGLG
jgi:beta-glucosidase